MARHVTFCMACGQLDDHPKHGIAVKDGTPEAVPSAEFLASLPDGAPVAAVARLLRPVTIDRHMDCCAALGCEVCQATEALNGGARGEALIERLASDKRDEGPVATLETADLKLGGVTNG